MAKIGEAWRRIPGKDLIIAGALTTVLTGVTIAVASPSNEGNASSMPDESNDPTLVAESKCAYHSELQPPFITGAHPDLTIKARPKRIDTSQGATLVFTDLRSNHQVIAGDYVAPGGPFPETQTHHGYVRGLRPHGYSREEDMELSGQRIQLDVVRGNLTKDQLPGAEVQATVVFEAAKCAEKHP